MKPALGGIVLYEGDPYGGTQKEEWRVIVRADDPLAPPFMVHAPTGVIFAMGYDGEPAPGQESTFAIPFGHWRDEFGNFRKVGKIALEKLGRSAIALYLIETGRWNPQAKEAPDEHAVAK